MNIGEESEAIYAEPIGETTAEPEPEEPAPAPPAPEPAEPELVPVSA